MQPEDKTSLPGTDRPCADAEAAPYLTCEVLLKIFVMSRGTHIDRAILANLGESIVSGFRTGIGSGVEVLSRVFAAGAEVLTAAMRQRIAGFDFAGGRVDSALFPFLLSGAQHPTSGIVARESIYDAGIIAPGRRK